MDEIINETIYHCAFRFIDPESNKRFFENVKIIEEKIKNNNDLNDIQKDLITKLILTERIDEFINYTLDNIEVK